MWRRASGARASSSSLRVTGPPAAATVTTAGVHHRYQKEAEKQSVAGMARAEQREEEQSITHSLNQSIRIETSS